MVDFSRRSKNFRPFLSQPTLCMRFISAIRCAFNLFFPGLSTPSNLLKGRNRTALLVPTARCSGYLRVSQKGVHRAISFLYSEVLLAVIIGWLWIFVPKQTLKGELVTWREPRSGTKLSTADFSVTNEAGKNWRKIFCVQRCWRRKRRQKAQAQGD